MNRVLVFQGNGVGRPTEKRVVGRFELAKFTFSAKHTVVKSDHLSHYGKTSCVVRARYVGWPPA
jgi:hypothetical protein